MPKVSVIIPTYKHSDFVLATLESVFAQTFTDYEIIVVNDGSPDDTADVLKPLADAGQICYIEQGNQGQAAARNKGLAVAQGEFIAFLDDDDLWPANKLEWQVRLMQANPETVLVYGFQEIMGDNAGEDWNKINLPSGNVSKDFLTLNRITSPGQTLIRKAALIKTSGFDPDLWGVDDWDLYIRLAKIGPFVSDSAIALFYRTHRDNASKDVSRMYQNACRLVNKHQKSYAENGLTGQKRSVNVFYANQFVQAALSAKRAEDWIVCRKMLWKAAHLHPNIIKERCFVAALGASLAPNLYSLLNK